MRVIDPKRAQRAQKKKKTLKKPMLLLCVVAIGVAAIYVILHSSNSAAPPPAASNIPDKGTNNSLPIKTKSGQLKTFTGQEFKDLYNNFTYPNTRRIGEDTAITGNDAADKRIRDVAIS